MHFVDELVYEGLTLMKEVGGTSKPCYSSCVSSVKQTVLCLLLQTEQLSAARDGELASLRNCLPLPVMHAAVSGHLLGSGSSNVRSTVLEYSHSEYLAILYS
jgi:hypothetical protein